MESDKVENPTHHAFDNSFRNMKNARKGRTLAEGRYWSLSRCEGTWVLGGNVTVRSSVGSFHRRDLEWMRFCIE